MILIFLRCCNLLEPKNPCQCHKVHREYPKRPVLAVAAVILRGDLVLLVKRAQEPSKGQWSLPGGVVELGEGVREALIREIREELSMEVSLGGLVDIVERIDRDETGEVRYHYVILEYWAEADDSNPKAGSDASEYRWVRIDELPKEQLSSEVKRVIMKAAARSRNSLT